MRTKNVQEFLDCDDVWAVPAALVRRPNQMLVESDILVSSANSWNLVGKCSWIPKLERPTSFGGFVSVLRGKKGAIDPRYLYRWFSSTRTQSLARSFGQKTTNISNLNIKRCLALDIPLPRLDDQRRIAAILDQADGVRGKRREALAQLDSLAQSIFIEMFGDMVSNSMDYPAMALGDLCDVRDGTHDSPKFVDQGYPLVTSKNLRNGEVSLEGVSFISEADYLSINRRSKVDQGDLLMPMIGTIGNPVIVRDAPHFAIKNVALIKFTKDSPSSRFIHQFLSGDCFDQLVTSRNKGGTQKFLALGEIRSIPVPVPPKSQQTRFEQSMNGVDVMRSTQRAALTLTDSLFASLQDRAFSGTL